MRNSKMLKFVPGYRKTKKKCKHAVQKLSFLIKYGSDRYNTQQIWDKAIRKRWNMRVSCYRNQ